MKNLNAIGLNTTKAKQLAEKLNELLANYSIFYQNVRGYHWNIKGEKFFELHVKFEELYTDLQLKIDEIAERILTLGDSPAHNYSAYKKNIYSSRKFTGIRRTQSCSQHPGFLSNHNLARAKTSGLGQ
jgi:starvation-inducible DNA-binding protein